MHRLMLIFLLVFPVLAACRLTSSRDQTYPGEPGSGILTLQVESLDGSLQENSGLIFFRDKLWTINDSGGDPILYAVDPRSGKVLQKIFLDAAINRDWEEIAQDAQYLYIGDTGNNYGRRTTLTIYRIPKKEIPMTGNKNLRPATIEFIYADREEETGMRRRSSHDCEAFFVCRDTVHLFTKNWQLQKTSWYRFPALPGSYEVHATAGFDADGLITAADISPDARFFILLGYKDYVPFVWIFTGYSHADLFSGSAERLEFPRYLDLQTEGLAIRSPRQVYISSEQSTFPPQLYLLDVSALLN